MEGHLPTLESAPQDPYRAFHTFGSSSTVFEASPFPDTYKKEKTCSVCEVRLCSTRGDLNRRHGCKFCLHAVCQKCAPLRLFHTASSRLERACVNCFRRNLEEQVRGEIEALRPKRDEELLELSQKLTEETKKRVQFEDEIGLLRIAKSENALLQSELTDAKVRNSDLESQLQALESDFEAHKLESAFKEKHFEASLSTFQQSADKHRKLYTLKAAELMGVRKQLEQYKALVEGMKAGRTSSVEVGIGVMAVKQIHDMQVQEMKGKEEELQGKLEAKCKENEALALKIRETEESANDRVSKYLLESQNILRSLAETEKTNEELKEEVNLLREQLERVAKITQFDAVEQFKEMKLDYERRLAQLQSRLDSVSVEKRDIETLKNRFSDENRILTSELEEQKSLLDLAKDEIISENQQKTDFESKLDRFSGYLGQLECMDELQAKLAQEKTKAQNACEQVARQRLELEQYKQQLRSTQEALDKGEELLRASQEQHQYERKMIYRKEAEIEALREVLQTQGIDPTGLTMRLDGESDLTRILREKEAKVGALGAELRDNLKRARGREKKPRTSGDSKGLGFKAATSTDPCACALF